MTSNYQLIQLERETIEESVYLSKLDTTIKLLIGDKEDSEVLLRYLADQFSKDEPIDFASGITPQDLAKRYKGALERSLNDSFTIIAVDCFEVCGLVTANRVKKGPKRVEKMKEDYKNDILTSNASSLAAKKIDVFVTEFESFSPNYLPEECNEFYRIDFFSVASEYRSTGLGKLLWSESLKLAHRHKFKYIESGCSAQASTKIGTNLGMKIAYSIPYKDFKVDGKPVFGEVLKDGSTKANMLIGDLDEISKTFVETDAQKIQLPLAYKLPPNKNRQVVEEFYVPKLDRYLRLEVACKETDASIVEQFMCQEFCKQDPLCRTAQLNKEEHQTFFSMIKKKLNEESLTNKLTFVITDKEHICGVIFNWIKPIKRIELKEEEFIEFYEESKKIPCEFVKIRKVGALVLFLQRKTPRYLPDDGSTELFYIDCLSVHPKYQGLQLGQKLWDHSLKEAHKRGYKWAQVICTAVGSTKIGLKSKMLQAFAYPLEQFKVEQKMVYPTGRLYDGCREASLFIGDLDKIFCDES